MTHASPPPSRQQRFFNFWARYGQRPPQALIKNTKLLRALSRATSPLTFKRPADMETRDRVLEHAGHSVPATDCTRKGQDFNGTLLYIHGGGFVVGDLKMYAHLIATMGAAAGLRGVYIDYRLAPEHPFPAATDDVLAAYQALLADPNTGPIAIAGDSAGGNLVLSLLAQINALGLTPPIATVALSPIVDADISNPSFITNQATDHLLDPSWGQRSLASYVMDHDKTDPILSPIHGDFTGCPPVMLHYDTTEVLADDGRLMVAHLRSQGVDVTTEVSTGRTHVWHLNVGRVPEADASVAAIGAFLKAQI